MLALQGLPWGVILKKLLLNVGGNSKEIGLPALYSECRHVLLDIDASKRPDIVCDGRQLMDLQEGRFDIVYCSHNLEHYYSHEVPWVLDGFMHVLKDGGFAHIRVPDILGLMRLAVERELDLDDVLYTAPVGPIMVKDVLYGYGKEIEVSGQDFFAHKTGFSPKTLLASLSSAGFSSVYMGNESLEISAIAFKGDCSEENLRLLGLAE